MVDAAGLKCPLPLLKAKLALNGVLKGQIVEILATDVGSVKDIRTFTDLSSHELLVFSEQDGVYKYLIRKGDQFNSTGEGK